MPYRGTAPALNDVISGAIDFLCDQATILVPQVQAGSVKALVVSSAKRLKVLPDVPSAPEAQVPDYLMSGWNALFAPKGTPARVIETYREALQAALRDEMVMSRFDEVAAEIPAPELTTVRASEPLWPRKSRAGPPWCARPASGPENEPYSAAFGSSIGRFGSTMNPPDCRDHRSA